MLTNPIPSLPSNERFLTVVLPVWNEELVLEKNTLAVLEFCSKTWPGKAIAVVIADNGSTDRTSEIGQRLEQTQAEVKYLHLAARGKGWAIHQAWLDWPAAIFCFMDIDLAADLQALPHLIQAIGNGTEIAYGSRTRSGAIVQRSFGRRAVSRAYQWLTWFLIGVKGDLACGLKAVSPRVVKELLPLVENHHFAFDRELLILGRVLGYCLKELPVFWVETREPRRKSKIALMAVAWADLKHLWHLRKRLRQLDKPRNFC